MRISVTKPHTDNATVYVIKDVYLKDVRGRKSTSSSSKDRTTKTVKCLGKVNDIIREHNLDSYDSAILWAKNIAKSMTEESKKDNQKISINLDPTLRIEKDVDCLFNCGYLFLQSICSSLRFDNMCRNIKSRHKYLFDIEAILTDLIYARILEPSSKRSSYKFCSSLLEPPKYEEHDVYRALSILSKEMDYIQSSIYEASNFVVSRNNHILYYDCTNYFFEIEAADNLRQYGKSKEHRPNPIVQMGLFMDGDGLPLAFSIFSGASNEQPSLKPLEEKIIQNYNFDKFVVCTDGGLGSDDNRQFNDIEGRAFITTQSLKKLKKSEREIAMSPNNWKRLSDGKFIKNIDEIFNNPDKYPDEMYYKEQPYGTSKVPNQLMIVTYSPKYALYQKSIREDQLSRAKKIIESGKKKTDRNNPNDPSRFIKKTTCTKNGEIAENTIMEIDEEKVSEEAKYDGFYAVCTDLVEEAVSDILKVSENRWEIEESFRIMKTDFKSRPVHLSREDRIKAHFLTCYLALLVYRLIEKKLDNKYTTTEILQTLRSMKLMSIDGIGYKPAYKRTNITDDLHKAFGFYTDFEILKKSTVKSIIHQTKNK